MSTVGVDPVCSRFLSFSFSKEQNSTARKYTHITFTNMATIISALPLNPPPIDSRTTKTTMLATTTLTPTKRPSPTPPPSPRPAPSPPQPPPPTENQALTATLFASRPFDLVQGSQVQIGWKSTGPLYSVSLRLVRQSPVPAGIIVRWPDVLPETSTVTVAMPSNANVNQVQPPTFDFRSLM